SVAQVLVVLRVTTRWTGWPAATVTSAGSNPFSVTAIAIGPPDAPSPAGSEVASPEVFAPPQPAANTAASPSAAHLTLVIGYVFIGSSPFFMDSIASAARDAVERSASRCRPPG